MSTTTFTNGVTLTDEDWFNDVDATVYEYLGDGTNEPSSRSNMRDNIFTGGTVTASTPVINATQTWNNGAVTFTGLKFNVTSTAAAAASLLADLQVGGSSIFNIGKGGQVQINDTTQNANMAVGLSINQGPANDEIAAFKSSNIAHGMTSLTETDTYGFISKFNANNGGLYFRGFSEVTGGLILDGTHTTDDTTKSTAANGAVVIAARLKSTTTSGNCGADANLMVVGNNGTIRFIMDAEGSFHADVESTTFDDHDDIALLNAFDMEFQRRQGDPVKKEYAKWLKENRATLQRLGIVNYYDPKGKRAMVNMTKLAMLHNGAIRQLASRVEKVERKRLT